MAKAEKTKDKPVEDLGIDVSEEVSVGEHVGPTPGAEAPAMVQGDFSLSDEYKPDPICAGGNYRGNVVLVSVEGARQCVAWKVCLAGNGGFMSDAETPIDGSHHYYRNWLPKQGDENIMTSSGRSTKRQAKINMMKQFSEGLKVSMDTPQEIMKNIQEGNWIGLPVIVTLGIDSYQGVVRNQIEQMVLDSTVAGAAGE